MNAPWQARIFIILQASIKEYKKIVLHYIAEGQVITPSFLSLREKNLFDQLSNQFHQIWHQVLDYEGYGFNFTLIWRFLLSLFRTRILMINRNTSTICLLIHTPLCQLNGWPLCQIDLKNLQSFFWIFNSEEHVNVPQTLKSHTSHFTNRFTSNLHLRDGLKQGYCHEKILFSMWTILPYWFPGC